MRRRFAVLAASIVLSAAGCQHAERGKGPSASVDAHQAYLTANAVDYDWFAHAANGYAGVPLVLLRALPDLAPDIWGKAEENFSRFGLFDDPERPNAPLPLGLSWDAMDSVPPRRPLHQVALTCGACHIGRVRLNDGKYMITVGGPNTQFDVRKWRRAFELTASRLRTPEEIETAAVRLRQIIAEKPANFFYRNSLGPDSKVEVAERQYFLSNTDGKNIAAGVLKDFADKIRLAEIAVNKQKATSYSKVNAPPLDGGSPGQADGSGDLIPRLLMLKTIGQIGVDRYTREFMAMDFPALPKQMATVTDILSTWQQGSRNVAQIDGSVKSPYYRNIAASLAVAGVPELVNAANAEFTARFVSKLPPPAYPFGIQNERASRGRALFKANCAACHRPFNDTVYPTALIGTDPNRSRVLNSDGLKLFVEYFVASVPENLEAKDANNVKYRPRDLPKTDIVFDRTTLADQGYVTDALDGLWARAPYLHNGAVPTVYHVLIPAERPAKFVRGSIDYERDKLGFAWDTNNLSAYRRKDVTAAVFDTAWDSASRLGHDSNLTIDAKGKILRKGWDGPPVAGEVRVRLDWGGAENKEALGDLLEFLKTL